ncbi:MAG: hypothetical protein JW966_06870 [Anaerolineae bacterium]|nr:hypothetical protein [Anaerolineae bacterium]
MIIMTQNRANRRPALRHVGLGALRLALCLALISVLWAASPARAQEGPRNRQLTVGDIVTGTLDADTFVQAYSLTGSAGDTINIDVVTEAEELAPVVILTGPDSELVAQDRDLTSPTTATLAGIELPSSGTYTILVVRGSGAEGDASGEFTLELSGVQQVGGQTAALDIGGVVFELIWAAAVDLNLEVRDPVGGTVHAFSPGAPSGGTLDADVNANCDAATANNPTETIAWPAGEVPAGSYEIIIYYIDGCEVGGPQRFTLNGSANNEDPTTIDGTLNPGQRYLARMEVAADGSWTLSDGGVNAGLNVTVFNNQIANAESIALGSTISGTITNGTPAEVYTFDVISGTTVTISMVAQSGSLDTYLALLGPDQTPLISNDDDGETTNAAITRELATNGTYTIIATRYGLNIGGTEGDYVLTLSTGAGETETPAVAADTAEVTAEAIELSEGAIEITLSWLTNADLQLQVRDPSGETVYDDLTQIRSGGTLEADGNRNCEETTASPVSYIYWPPNRLTPGIYEVEVWYQSNCEDTTPVNFALTVDVSDQTIINTSQPVALNAHYMITFRVEADGTATAGPGGFFDMSNANTLNYTEVANTAATITYGGTVSGSITERQRFVVYAFEGQQGDIVTIGMDATGGTLDPALYLVSPEGIQIDFNDDVTPGENPNSVIENTTLVSTGTYYIIATHYGLNVGGTEGTYNLTLIQE